MSEDARILIVDDDPQILAAQARLLESAGYHVAQASTGEEALRVARTAHPNLVLLDVVLPDIDGLQVCRRLKADPSLQQTLVVLLSAVRTTSDDQALALEMGGDGMITRPIGNRELLARVETFLRVQRAEAELRASETRFREIFERAPVGTYQTTPEGQILMANPALVEMLGYDSFEELVKRNLENEGYHPDYPREAFRQRMEREGRVHGLESAWTKKDGSTLFVRENARAVYDAEGRIVAYHGTAEDVTERVRRQERLKRLNVVLDALLDVSQLIARERRRGPLIEEACQLLVSSGAYESAAIWLLDEEGELRQTAQSGLREPLTSIAERTAGGHTDVCGAMAVSEPGVCRCVPPPDSPLAPLYGRQRLMAIRLEHGGTTWGLMLASLPPEVEVDEREDALLEQVAADLAFALHGIELREAHAAADRALQESQRRLATLMDNLPGMVYRCSIDPDWTMAFVSQGAEELTGYTPEQLINSAEVAYGDLIVPHDRQRVWDQIDGALDERNPFQITYRIVTAEGEERWVWERGRQVADENGDPVAMEGFITDITEQKEAQEALQRQIRATEASIDGIALLDDEGRYTHVNQAHAEIYGYDAPEALVGQTWRMLYDDAEQQRFEEEIMPQLWSEGQWRGEAVGRKRDGSAFPQELSLTALDDGGLICVVRDITDWKEAEQELRASKQRLELALEGGELAIWDWDVQSGELLFNARWAEILGYNLDEIPPRITSWEDLVHPDDLPEVRDQLNAHLEGKSPSYETVHRVRHRSGAWRWMLDRGKVIERDAEGKPLRACGTHFDITERKLAEEALRESEERFRTVLENLPGGVFAHDLEGRILLVNRTACTNTGYSRSKLLQMSVSDIDPFSVEREDRERLWQRLQAKESTTFESTHVRKDGSQYPAQLHLSGLTLGGQPGLLALAFDISERKQLEEELRQHERLAAVGQLAGGIAHDFNNILAGIILYAQMPLQRPDLPEDTQRALTTILKESHRAADLVQQILDFSRRAMLKTEPLSLVALVDDATSLLRRTIPESIELTTEMTPHPCVVQGDATRIHQALMNLVFNARDAMPSGGGLTISITPVAVEQGSEPLPDMPPGAYAQLRVTDTGTGLSQEAQDHLFEPFFTTKEPGEGTGLGLPQVYGIVKQHHGFIDVETARGEGTTFTLFLPLVDREVEGQEADTGPRAPEGDGETVLVVEDAARLRRAIQAGLESVGYTVISAPDGQAALETLKRQQVDLVLTDVVMPRLGGEALVEHLRRRDPGLAVIAMTGHVMESDMEALRKAGFDAALPKPFSIDELAEAVREVLEAR